MQSTDTGSRNVAGISGAWASRIVELLGSTIDDAEPENLQALVDGAVREDTDLDFKIELYGRTDSAKRDLAGDVAAMANERGGVIILGIREEAEVAVERVPLALPNGEEARMRQVVAGNVFPSVDFDVKVIDDGQEGLSYVILSVPPSPLRPHAVRVDHSLRYPRRYGSTTRWLAESEVADMYRDRYSLALAQTQRVDDVMEQGLQVLDISKSTFIAVALAPTSAGSMVIDQAALRAAEEWAVELGKAFWWRGFFRQRPAGGVAAKRITLSSIYDRNTTPKYDYAELHSDGSGFAAARWFDTRMNSQVEEPDDVWIENTGLLLTIAQSLRMLGEHAARTGVRGDVVLEARIVSPKRVRHSFLDPHGYPNASEAPPREKVPPSRHTSLLDSLVGKDQDLLAATRPVATDLVQALGHSELRQLAPDGTLRVPYFRGQTELRAFAEQTGVAVTDETVPE
jgi:hypothetical protein